MKSLKWGIVKEFGEINSFSPFYANIFFYKPSVCFILNNTRFCRKCIFTNHPSLTTPPVIQQHFFKLGCCIYECCKYALL